jgi:hypothetical protein
MAVEGNLHVINPETGNSKLFAQSGIIGGEVEDRTALATDRVVVGF